VGLCAICPLDVKIGCDLEKIEPRSPAFINDYFTQEELFLVKNTKKEDIPLMANLIWSAKESVLKAMRTGLSIDTRQVQIKCSLKKGPEIWNEFTIELPNFDLNFYGRWQVKAGFVITMVNDHEKFELNELS
jgi:4'-phosphopantetheinyl transferase